MKKSLVFLSLLLFVTTITFAQKKSVVEVLYFKANLSCCQAKSCAAMENDVKAIVEKNFTDGTVIFKEIKLADEANKEIVEKYKAKSQTIVLVYRSKKKEKSLDISDIVKGCSQNPDKAEMEKQLLAKISEIKRKL